MSLSADEKAVVEAGYSRYMEWEWNADCREEVEALYKNLGDDDKKWNEFRKLMGSRLAFGTAGLRGPMGGGFNKMNDLVILQTSQGLANYVIDQYGYETAINKGIVIGYDHRSYKSLSSLTFARITASVFVQYGFKVYLLENFIPTPFVPFAVNFYKCALGVMVTASHNPKIDNGYKVYWGNGAQIIPPHDSGIASAIENNLAPQEKYNVTDEYIMNHSLVSNVTTETMNEYYKSILTLSSRSDKNSSNTVNIVYTAMHGVGCQWLVKAFQVFNHKAPLIVPSQADPNPNFPTVSFPNPEEKGALDEAMKYAESVNGTVIIANDPDADRLAVAEQYTIDGNKKWYVFSGNEIGVLLGYWQIKRFQANNASNKEGVVLASVVSSRMLKAIASVEGITYYDTLTGFKWLGNRSIELANSDSNKQILLSYEEALGFCVGDVIFDKDGISAASVFTEMIGSLMETNMTIRNQLQYLYNTYGEYVSYNSYVICHDPRLTDRIFERLRTKEDGSSTGYWSSCAGVDIVTIKDITNGYDSTSADKKSDLPQTPDSHMIMYEFANGCSVTLRTSGTEPKIKFYTEMAGKLNEKRAEVTARLQSFVDQLVEEMLEPTKHGLQRP